MMLCGVCASLRIWGGGCVRARFVRYLVPCLWMSAKMWHGQQIVWICFWSCILHASQ